MLDMSLRDQFALIALPSVVNFTINASAKEMAKWARDSKAPEGATVADLTAMAAYAYADAMIKKSKEGGDAD
jgi:hypothetical protein